MDCTYDLPLLHSQRLTMGKAKALGPWELLLLSVDIVSALGIGFLTVK